MMLPPLTVSFVLNEDDALALSLASPRKPGGRLMRAQLRVNQAWFGLFLLIYFVYFCFDAFREPPLTSERLVFLSVIAVIFIIITIGYPRYVCYNVKKNARIGQKLSTARELQFSDDAVRDKTEYSDGVVSWQAFDRAVETKEQFILYTALRRGYIIPKRALKSEDEKSRLRQMISAHVSPFQKIIA